MLHPQALHTVRLRRELAEPVLRASACRKLRRCNPVPLRPGGGSCWAFRERGTRPLALCGTMGPEWNDLGFPIHVSWRRTLRA